MKDISQTNNPKEPKDHEDGPQKSHHESLSTAPFHPTPAHGIITKTLSNTSDGKKRTILQQPMYIVIFTHPDAVCFCDPLKPFENIVSRIRKFQVAHVDSSFQSVSESCGLTNVAQTRGPNRLALAKEMYDVHKGRYKEKGLLPILVTSERYLVY